ncbi:uroporphyrinogen-III synthase [Methylosoma difficile]
MMSAKPLCGRRILVTRPAHQAASLVGLIESAGGIAVKLPVLAIVETDNIDQIQQTLASVAHYQWLVFISANAVNFALKANGGKIGGLNLPRCAAIGSATAQAMKAAGLTVDLMPEQGGNSEALLAMPAMQQVAGQRFLLIRGQEGREHLAEALRVRGARVDYLCVYQRILPTDADVGQTQSLLAEDRLDAITLTSGEALENLLVMLASKNNNNKLFSIPLIVVSDRIRQMAAEKGFTEIAVANGPSDMAMFEAVTMLMGK